jgi:NADPH:quinone reductase-like Zn-dependent oxidoreductase
MKTSWLPAFSSDASAVQVQERDKPIPGPGQLLVRMRLAPVHPSDFNYIRGTYLTAYERMLWNYGAAQPLERPGAEPFPRPPYALGVEGVGVVESAGPGLLGKGLTGRRVAVVGGPPNGTWTQYATIEARRAFPVSSSLSDEQACSFFVNPLTSLALVRSVLGVPRGAWLLQTAAGSALGQMVRNLAKLDGFEVINVVRSRAGAERLAQAGAQHVIALEDQDLLAAVRALTAGQGVPYVLDCVGGPGASDALRCLSPGGQMVCFGTLSGQPIPLEPRDLMMPGTRIEAFYLPIWLAKQSVLQRLSWLRSAAKLIGQGVLSTPVRETLALEDIQRALALASEPGGRGKILLDLR